MIAARKARHVSILLVWCHPNVWKSRQCNFNQRDDINCMFSTKISPEASYWSQTTGVNVTVLSDTVLDCCIFCTLWSNYTSSMEALGFSLLFCFLTLESVVTVGVHWLKFSYEGSENVTGGWIHEVVSRLMGKAYFFFFRETIPWQHHKRPFSQIILPVKLLKETKRIKQKQSCPLIYCFTQFEAHYNVCVITWQEFYKAFADIWTKCVIVGSSNNVQNLYMQSWLIKAKFVSVQELILVKFFFCVHLYKYVFVYFFVYFCIYVFFFLTLCELAC